VAKTSAILCQGYLSLLVLTNEGKSAASLGHQVSISPTFYEQILRQNPFAKKLQTKIVSI
jgi:hypothetical protein